MSDFENFTQKFIAFRNERDWQQFHKPKDVALSLALEAAEVLELFQWKTDEQAAQAVKENPEKFADELADVMGWVLILAHDLKIDLAAAMEHKLAKNAAKYPIERAKGNSKKYTEL
ncbi:nucleotide pyrophosphohydrolase [Candidatus Dependentiae bacterium]|nr:nucleotide pyrophosphohydrolase [Candidatus Dependentiae bacterium]MCC7415024.1 nucleotide pyrophosphohydrolase [Campylobacterota bacterium]